LIESLDKILAEVFDFLPLRHAEAHDLSGVEINGVCKAIARAASFVLIVEHACSLISLGGALSHANSGSPGRLSRVDLGSSLSDSLNVGPVLELIFRKVTVTGDLNRFVLTGLTALVTI